MLVQDLIALDKLSAKEKAQIITALSLAEQTNVATLKSEKVSETFRALLAIKEFNALKESERLARELALHLHDIQFVQQVELHMLSSLRKRTFGNEFSFLTQYWEHMIDLCGKSRSEWRMTLTSESGFYCKPFINPQHYFHHALSHSLSLDGLGLLCTMLALQDISVKLICPNEIAALHKNIQLLSELCKVHKDRKTLQKLMFGRLFFIRL